MSENPYVCPVWVGKLMVSPLRKLYQNSGSILSTYIFNGAKILEIGPGLGYFSLPMAKMTGSKGKVYCVDIQEGMLSGLRARATKAGINNIQAILSTRDSFNIEPLKNQIDFVLLFAVVHEVPNQDLLFRELDLTLKNNGLILFSEPKGHVKSSDFERSISIAREYGYKVQKNLKIRGSHAVLLQKTQ